MKKRVIKKRKGSIDETTEIVTIEEEGKKPDVSVTVTEEKPKQRKTKKPKDKKVKKVDETLITEEGYLFVPTLAEETEIKAEPEEILDLVKINIFCVLNIGKIL